MPHAAPRAPGAGRRAPAAQRDGTGAPWPVGGSRVATARTAAEPFDPAQWREAYPFFPFFEMDPAASAAEREQFMPIVEWVDPECRARAESKVIELSRPAWAVMSSGRIG